MTELAALEINSSGNVTSVSVPSSSFWEGLLPAMEKNIFQHWDEPVTNQLKEFVQQLFNSSLPVKRSININKHTFVCTAFRSNAETATICWETTPGSKEKPVENEGKRRVELVNFAFENANTPIHFVREDGSFYDFNDALTNMLGYTRDEFFRMNIFEVNPNLTKENWKLVWKNLRESGSGGFYSLKKKKNGSFVDTQLKGKLINYQGIELFSAFIIDITERKKLENELQIFNFSFRKMSAPIIYFRKDGSIYDCNDAYCKLFGFERDEIMKLSLFDFGAAYTNDSFQQYWERVRTSASFSFVSTRTRKDGIRIDLEISPNYIKFGDVELICSTLKEITEQKKLEQQLKLVGYAFENANTAIYFITQDGSYYLANETMYAMLGYSLEEFRRLTISDINPSITNEIWGQIWLRQKEGSSRTIQQKLKRKDGELIDVEINAKIISYEGTELSCAFIADVTERKRLDESLKLVDFAFTTSAVPMHMIAKDGKVFDCNIAACKTLGYTEEEYKALTIFDINKSISKEQFNLLWNEIPVDTEKAYNYKLSRKDNELVDVEIRSNKIIYGDLELLCSSFIDVTEKKKLEDSLKLVDFAFRNAAVPMHFIKEDGQLFDCNQAACQLLGYTSEEYKKLTVFDVNRSIPKEGFKRVWNNLSVETDKVMYYKVTKKNGELIDIEVRSNKINYGNLELMCSSFLDISEKKRIEARLNMVDYAFKNASISMQFLRPDGSIYDFNKKASETLGYTTEEYKNIGLFDFTLRHTPESWRLRWQDLKNGNNETFVTKIRRKDGSAIDVEIRTDIILYENEELAFTCTIDVSDKKAIEEKLKIVDYAFRNATIPMHLLRKDGSVYDFNSNSPKLLGYTDEEFKNVNIFDFSTRHTPETWKERWKDFKKANKLSNITKLRRKDNTLVDVELITDIVFYGNEELTFTTIIDLTEKNKTAQRLKVVEHAFRNATIPMHFLRKDGSVYDFNKNTPKLLGYTEEEFWDVTLFDYSTRHTQETWIKRWDDFKDSTKNFNITKFRRKDNSLVDVELRTDIVMYENEELSFSSVIDITEKLRTEQKLKIVDYAFKNASICMIFFRKDGSIIDFNEKAYQLLGYSEDEFVNVSIFDISIRHNVETWERRWDELTSNTHTIFTTIVKKKDHSLLDVEIRSDLFLYDNEILNFTSIIDITEKKKAEVDLRRSNERYENALIATSDVIWEADLLQDRTYFSKNFTLIFGHPLREIEDRAHNTCRINIHPDDLAKVIAINDDLTNGVTDKWDFEYRMKKADGNYALVLDRGFTVKDENGRVLRLVGALQDNTQKKAEESRLKLLESVVVNTNDAIVIANAEPIDDPGPIIIYVNDAYSRITGYSLGESVGTNPRKVHNENTDRKELDRFRKALENWQPCEMTVRNVRKNGEEFWANVRVTPVANEKGQYTHWISVQRDVTKEIEAQKERETLLNELINNNNELKQFGYITTHNLRAPLTNLVSISKMIDENKIEDTLTRRLIGGFKQSTFLLNDTLNDLIRILFIKERMNITTNELLFGDALDKVKGLISSSIESKNVLIEADFSTAPTVRFSSIYLESIFLNLMTNAIKYAHPSRDPIINIKSLLLPDNRVKLTFSDNGLGMNMQRVQGRIFGLYQRFHNNPDSKGLGLYLIHSQVTALGGTIDVESKENYGTTFTIIFKNEGKKIT